MSDITIGVCFSDDTAQKTQTARQKKRLRKKMRHLEQNRYKEGKYKRSQHRGQFRHNQTPQHNGESPQRPPPPASTHNAKSLPRPGSAAHCSSGPPAPAHSLPPRTFTVNSKDDSNEKPKEPANANSATPGPSGPSSHKPAAPSAAFPTKYLAIDCEMVGGGPKGSISLLARCSIVSYEGDVVYDKFIKPSMPVTDYRTRWSGIRHRDLANATSYSEAQKEILKLLKGKVVIGHAIHNDFKALGYTHPAALTRDTSRIPLLNRKAGFAENDCASLKRLTKAIFDRNIQTGRKGHSSVEDARATMELYKVVEAEWERKLASTSQAS